VEIAMSTTVTSATRQTAIAGIIGNSTIATSKALLIEEIVKQMENGICHFMFTKKDGSVTERLGTLNPALCSQHIKGTGKSPELRGCTFFWGCSQLWLSQFSMAELHCHSVVKNPTVSKNIICIFLNKLFPIFPRNKSYNKNPRFI
jgi:hypothetical protein